VSENSGANAVPASMSTRQIGHRRFCASHWSTHDIWKRCMHGKRLQDTPPLHSQLTENNSSWMSVPFFFFSYACHEPELVSHKTASSSAQCSRDKPPFSFVRGQDSTMWDIVSVSPQRHRSVSVSRHSVCRHRSVPVPCENGSAETSVFSVTNLI